MIKLIVDGFEVPLFSQEVLDTQEKQEGLVEDYKATFCSPQGARVLAHLASKAMFDCPTFDPDQRVEAQNEGMRRLFLSILRQVSRPTMRNIKKQGEGEV
jgi:hypothetical protein